ncbi:MAG: AAA family ATPase [Anaerolineales bacterium]|nr:AAA family ATPase [Anaerolineales bacterium]
MTLAIRLLGIPEVVINEKPVHFKTNKVLALLVFLTMEQKRYSREYLIALLWPDSSENLGRASLRNALAHLRTILGDYADQCLVTQEDTIGIFLPPEVDFDVRSLSETADGLSKKKVISEVTDLQDQIQTLEKITSYYRGDFLSGVDFKGSPEFEEWILCERQQLHLQYTQLLTRLFELQFSGGQISSAVNTARLWLTHDPLSDEACRNLMTAYSASGDKTSALRTFEQFISRLERELQCPPESQTEALAQQLQRAGASSKFRIEKASIPTANISTFPFVGRTQEFNQLVTSYFEATRNGSQIAAIIGEAGIGKTRLVEEFLRWVETQQTEILAGSAWEGSNRVPYQPIVESLRVRLDEERSLDELLDKVWLAELARLLPEIRTKIQDLPQSITDESTARQALFEAVTQLANALTRKSPLVWVIEDLHWSDIASMDLLSYALRSWSRHRLPIFMIVTVREEAIDDIPNFKRWLAALSRDVICTPIELDSLNQKDISAFVEQIKEPFAQTLDRDNSIEEISAWLWEETGGQPLLLTETMKMHLEKGISLRPSSQTELPGWREFPTTHTSFPDQEFTSGISRIIQWRMSRLSPIASELARAAAILGHQFSFSVLIRVAEAPEEKALSAIEELLNGRILQLISDSGGSGNILYQFIHGKIKAVVEASIPQTMRIILHRRAFHALQEYHALPAELAYHARKSNQIEQAFRYCVIAGNNAMELFDPHDAIYYYEKARHLLDERLGPTLLKTILPVDLIEQLYIKLSLAYEIITEWDNARKIYETLLNLAKETRQRELEWTALNRLAILSAQHSFNVAEAMKFVEQALIVAEQIGDPIMIAETEWNLTQMATFSWQPELAIQHGERALAIAKQLDTPELTARILYALGDALSFAGRWEECNAKLEEALPIYAQINKNYISNKLFPAQYVWAGLPPSEMMSVQAMQASCMSQLAEGYMHVGKLIEGIQTARQALDIGVSINNDWTQAMTSLILGNGLIEIGAYEEAYRVGQNSVNLAAKSPNPALLFFAKNVYGLACQALYEYKDAQKQFLEALEIVAELPSKYYHSYVISKLCMNAVKQENWDKAVQYAYQSIENRRATPTALIVMDLHRHYEINALLHNRDIDFARQEISQFAKRVGNNQRYLVSYHLCCATLSWGIGQPEKAIENLNDAIKIAESIGLKGEIWQIYQMLATIYQANQQNDKAAQTFMRVQELLDELVSQFTIIDLKTSFHTLSIKQKFFPQRLDS